MTQIPAGREFFEVAVASCVPVYERHHADVWHPRHWKLGLESPLVRVAYAALTVVYEWERGDDPIKRMVATDLSIFFTGGSAELFFETVQHCMVDIAQSSTLVVFEHVHGSSHYCVAPLPDIVAFLTKKRTENELFAAFSLAVAQYYAVFLRGDGVYTATVSEWANRRMAARLRA